MVSEDIAARVTSYIQHQGAKSPEALVDLVTTSQERFLGVVDPLADDLASRKPGEDEWSLRELIRHVIDAEERVATLVHDLARGARPAGGREAGMMLEDDGRPFAEFVAQLREVNASLLQALRTLPTEPNLVEKANHPFFGPLNCKEWAAFQRVHDEDHVQHAGKIIAAVG
jgi:DinB family protein